MRFGICVPSGFVVGAVGQGVVFGKPLQESLRYANVQISTANANGELYVWGYIPVVVAKWCVYPLVLLLSRFWLLALRTALTLLSIHLRFSNFPQRAILEGKRYVIPGTAHFY